MSSLLIMCVLYGLEVGLQGEKSIIFAASPNCRLRKDLDIHQCGLVTRIKTPTFTSFLLLHVFFLDSGPNSYPKCERNAEEARGDDESLGSV